MKTLQLHPKQTALVLLFVVLLLTLVHSAARFVLLRFHAPEVLPLLPWVDLDLEHNIPSIYSGAALLLSSLLFLVIGYLEQQSDNRSRLYWFGLSCIFMFLSIDEWFALHEEIGDITESYIHATGLLYFPWVVPYSILTFLLALPYSKFLLRLPRKTASLFVLSGGMYLAGAVLLDMLGGREAETNGYYSAAYSILCTAEEFLEMSAVVLLIYTLLEYMKEGFGEIRITVQIASVEQ